MKIKISKKCLAISLDTKKNGERVVFFSFFYLLLTVHLSTIFVINQLNAQILVL